MAILTLAEYKQYYGLQHIRNVGSGINDMSVDGVDENTPALTYRVQIDGTGTPDTFKWSDDGGTTWDAETVSITGSAQALNNGIEITFAATTGHTSGDYWQFSTANMMQDDAIETCITDAANDFQEETHRVFEDPGSDATRYYDCHAPAIKGKRLTLDRDLYSITSITNGDDDVLTSSEYVTMPRNSADVPYWAIDLRSDSGLVWTYQTNWENAIKVIGRWCYSTTAPTDVIAAVRSLARHYAELRGLHGGTRMGPGDEALALPESWPAYVQRKLQKYRRV